MWFGGNEIRCNLMTTVLQSRRAATLRPAQLGSSAEFQR
jgi:hypothetical protein